MPYPLNNVTTADSYTPQATLQPPHPCRKLLITVNNKPVFVRMERCDNSRVGGGIQQAEELWIPGVYGITRNYPVGQVEFRSATSGNPAQVIATVDLGT